MEPFYIEISEASKLISFDVGDLLIDHVSPGIGILRKRIHRVDIEFDDLYFWQVYWTHSKVSDILSNSPGASRHGEHEEESLRISVALGYFSLFKGKPSNKKT